MTGASEPLRVDTLIGSLAARSPEAVAVEDLTGRVTYGELWSRSQRAARSISRLAQRPGLIPVVGQRGVDWVIACLAIMRAGHAFVPIDPGSPAMRRARMIEDLGADLVVRAGEAAGTADQSVSVEDLTSADTEGTPGPGESVRSDGDLGQDAYGIFTSGSTGRPKLVVVQHRGLAHLARWHRSAYGVGPGTRILQTASLGFDASVWELWPNLAAGATVVVAPDHVRMVPSRLVEHARLHRIDLLFASTLLAEMVMASIPDRDVPWRTLLTGGDLLHVERVPDGWRLVNHYGPTEATVVATAWTVSWVPGDRRAPIGGPIAPMSTRVVNPDLSPVLPGDEGELLLGGPMVARGYHGMSELTHARFISSENGSGVWYRTGDLVHEGPEGLEFHGRMDQQVQVRGVRLEMGEVEAALLAHPDVLQAVCCTFDAYSGQPSLGAAVVTNGGATSARELRRFLLPRLPAAIIPSHVAVMNELPTNPHGKIDIGHVRHQLAALQKERG